MSRNWSSHRKPKIDGVIVVPGTEVREFHDLTVTAMGFGVGIMGEPTTEPREVGITHPANLLTLTRLVFAPCSFGSCSTPMPTGGVLGGVRSRHRPSRRRLLRRPGRSPLGAGAAAVRSSIRWPTRSSSVAPMPGLRRAVVGAGHDLRNAQLGITAYRSRWSLNGLALPAEPRQVQDLRAGTRTHPGGDADARESRHRDRRVVVGCNRLDDLQRGAVSRWAKCLTPPTTLEASAIRSRRT